MARKNTTTINFDPMNIFSAFDPARSAEQFMDMMNKFKAPVADMEPVVEFQRKGLDAANAASNAAIDGMRAITERQATMVRDSIDTVASNMKTLGKASDPKEVIEHQIAFSRCAMEKTASNVTELGDLAVKTSNEVFAPIAEHVRSSIEDVTAMTAMAGK